MRNHNFTVRSWGQTPKADPFSEARAQLTLYEQTCALVAALEQRDLDRIRYKTKPEASATVASYMSTILYTSPGSHYVGTPCGIILTCATHPIDKALPPLGRRACALFEGGTRRDAITLRIFEVHVTLLEGDFGLRCAMNFAAVREAAAKRAPLFKGKRYA